MDRTFFGGIGLIDTATAPPGGGVASFQAQAFSGRTAGENSLSISQTSFVGTFFLGGSPLTDLIAIAATSDFSTARCNKGAMAVFDGTTTVYGTCSAFLASITCTSNVEFSASRVIYDGTDGGQTIPAVFLRPSGPFLIAGLGKFYSARGRASVRTQAPFDPLRPHRPAPSVPASPAAARVTACSTPAPPAGVPARHG